MRHALKSVLKTVVGELCWRKAYQSERVKGSEKNDTQNAQFLSVTRDCINSRLQSGRVAKMGVSREPKRGGMK